MKEWLQANREEYESDVLDQTLSQFYAKFPKENGDDYEPDCPKVMQASLERSLNSNLIQSPSSEIESWKERPGHCDSKVKESDKTDAIFWQNGLLGRGTQRTLLNIMW